jgi:hypothetical protein
MGGDSVSASGSTGGRLAKLARPRGSIGEAASFTPSPNPSVGA